MFVFNFSPSVIFQFVVGGLFVLMLKLLVLCYLTEVMAHIFSDCQDMSEAKYAMTIKINFQ